MNDLELTGVMSAYELKDRYGRERPLMLRLARSRDSAECDPITVGSIRVIGDALNGNKPLKRDCGRKKRGITQYLF